jgi:hypothetical protein
MNCLSVRILRRMGRWSGKTGFQAMYCNMKGPTPLYTAHEKITILFYYIIVHNN